MINKQLFTYVFMGLLCIPAINGMDNDGNNNAAEKFRSIQRTLEKQGLPQEIRHLIEKISLTNEIKEARMLFKKMNLSPDMGLSERIQVIGRIYFLSEKGKNGLKSILRTDKGKYLPSELSSDKFEDIKDIPSDLLQNASPYQTIEDFTENFYEVPKDVLHQEERKNNLLRIAALPLLGGCMGGVFVFSASVSALLEGKSLMSKNDAIAGIAALAALTQAVSVVDYLEMEYKYNFSGEKIPSVYRKKIDPFKKWRSAGTDFKEYANSQKYKDWQRSVALTE